MWMLLSDEWRKRTTAGKKLNERSLFGKPRRVGMTGIERGKGFGRKKNEKISQKTKKTGGFCATKDNSHSG